MKQAKLFGSEEDPKVLASLEYAKAKQLHCKLKKQSSLYVIDLKLWEASVEKNHKLVTATLSY